MAPVSVQNVRGLGPVLQPQKQSYVRVSPVLHGLFLVCVASSYYCCPPTLCSCNNEEPLQGASRSQSLSAETKDKIKKKSTFSEENSISPHYAKLAPMVLRFPQSVLYGYQVISKIFKNKDAYTPYSKDPTLSPLLALVTEKNENDVGGYRPVS